MPGIEDAIEKQILSRQLLHIIHILQHVSGKNQDDCVGWLYESCSR
ncbi:MAG: hypothetical protein JWN42_3024, partial [Candidatus Angelobacter sp.]|nr:hypothetical protein [Candidatus Angelobacter sp.]